MAPGSWVVACVQSSMTLQHACASPVQSKGSHNSHKAAAPVTMRQRQRQRPVNNACVPPIETEPRTPSKAPGRRSATASSTWPSYWLMAMHVQGHKAAAGAAGPAAADASIAPHAACRLVSLTWRPLAGTRANVCFTGSGTWPGSILTE
jgi:hypothetical protein